MLATTRRLALALAATAALPAAGTLAAEAAAADTSRSTAVARSDKSSFPESKLILLMPEHIGEWKRVKLGNPLTGHDHDIGPAMRAQYARGNQRVDVQVVDVGKAGALAAKAAARAASAATPAAGDRFYTAHGRVVREEHPAGSDVSSASVYFDNGINVHASGRNLDGTALQEVIEGLDLSAAARLERGGS